MKANEIDTIYSKIITSVLDSGVVSNPRGQQVKELYNIGWQLEDARNSIILSPVRKINYAYAVVEMLGLLRDGPRNVEPYCWYNSKMKQFLNPETGNWDGSYADRLYMFSQLPAVYKILKDDPFSRRAVVGIYNPGYDFHSYESRDVCCSLNLIFRLRDGKLNATFTIRSNDVLLGVPYDLTQFTFLQSVLASWLGVEVGSLYYFAANLHAYERDWDRLRKIAGTQWTKDSAHPLATMPKWDIASIPETLAQVERLFSAERALRADPSTKNLQRLIKKHRIDSPLLGNLLATILLPYQQRKLARGQKKHLLFS